MSIFPDICSLRKNPAITEKPHRVNWMVIQGSALGLMLGITSRAVWDQGIVSSIALTLKDLGVAVWLMLQDLAAVCWDFIQLIVR